MRARMYVFFKKRISAVQNVAHAAATTISKSPRLFVYDKNTKLHFLVDSGSDVSILPKKYLGVSNKSFIFADYTLNAANETPIATYGLSPLCIDIGLPKKFYWNFVIAEMEVPILGADFLQHYHLIPDLTKRRIYDGVNLTSTICAERQSNTPAVQLVKEIPTDPRIKDLLDKFPTLTRPPRYHEKPNHDVLHYIYTHGPPVHAKVRRLRPDISDRVKNQFDAMIDVGTCSHSSSDWSSGLVVVEKKDDIRIAGDYRRLNERTVSDRYPLSDLRDVTNKLDGKYVYSCIDLIRAFFNIPVYHKHVKKTALITPFGLFEYNRMPFGLKNAPATFQRFINAVLSGLDFVFCYMDDILVFSESESQHIEHLAILFERLNKFGLAVNLKKCRFLRTEVNFLGHKIGTGVFQPTDERVQFIKQLSKPTTITALRRVIGILGFYRRFCRNAAQHLAPFNDILKGHTKKNDKTPVPWTPQLEADFEHTKQAFAEFVLLHFPTSKASSFLLTCDASGSAVGAVLEQVVNAERQPLGFYSAKLDERQQQ